MVHPAPAKVLHFLSPCRQLRPACVQNGPEIIQKKSAVGAINKDCTSNYKQLLDEVFVISGIIKVEVSVISRSRRLRLITLTETSIIPDITKTESNNCFIIHCFEENNDKRIIAAITVYFQTLNIDIAVRALDIALGNHALRAQPTDYSLICRYRLVNNL